MSAIRVRADCNAIRRIKETAWRALALGGLLVCATALPARAEERAAAPPAPSAETIDNDTCLACHGDPAAERFVDPDAFAHSIHGQNRCTSCHADVTGVPHDVSLTAIHWQHIPETCGRCHGDVYQAYLRGIHGQAVAAGKREAPVCTDCHGAHAIAPVKQATSRVFPSHVPETCGQCHAAERIITKYQLPAHVVETYMQSFHGLSLQLGAVTAANCASCHGAHDILPSSDERSSIHPANLVKTCGQCHAGVSAQVAKGQIHSGTRPGLEHRLVGLVRRFYLWLIFLVVGGMLIHNALDFRRKLQRRYAESRRQGRTDRMTLNERLQHGLLIIAFVALAYTGFALKFPQAWWASPFVGRFDWRSVGHRLAAMLFVALAVYHAWFMFGTPRGRKELRALWPGWTDIIQPFQMLGYYVGFRRERPVFARYSYVEKAEYWALVWGSIIMTITGGFMTWQDWTLRHFPKWLFDVMTAIHYYEAILACLAILVWHFYFTVFDPDEYPMKWTWVTGKTSSADETHRTADPH